MDVGCVRSAIPIVQRAKHAQALRGLCARLVKPLFIERQLPQQTQGGRRIMHVAESPMLDQCFVEELSCRREIKLIERTLARVLDRKRRADHAVGVFVESCAIEKQASRLGVLAPKPGDAAEHQEREPLTRPVAGRFRESMAAEGKWLNRGGALPAPSPRLNERRFGFATGVVEFPCQGDCLAEYI